MKLIECSKIKFITHPNNIPIKIELKKTFLKKLPEVHDNECHGLIIKRKSKISLNQILKINIKVDEIDFNGIGVVAFCNKVNEDYEIGIVFIKSCDPFSIKMTLQICQIKDFIDSNVNKDSDDVKALNWIKLNASTF